MKTKCFARVHSRLAGSVLLAIMLVGQVAAAGTAANPFVPEQVFAGASSGKGELQLVFGKPRPFTVASFGTMQHDGRLRLAQQVKFEGEPVKSRAWVIWKTGPDHYSGTLTEAAGPVVGVTSGSRMTLLYPLNRWGLVMHQTLDLTGHGTVLNSGSIRFLGLQVGRLREIIRLKQ